MVKTVRTKALSAEDGYTPATNYATDVVKELRETIQSLEKKIKKRK
jgi:hypothetical protein